MLRLLYYRGITNRVQARYLLKILFYIGFVFACTRVENFHFQNLEFSYHLIHVNNELVIDDQPNKDHILLDYDERPEVSSARTELIHCKDTYGHAIISYNALILTKYKAIISSTKYRSAIISIIQRTNIWHKSSPKEPVLN